MDSSRFASLERSIRLLNRWQLVLSVLLLVSLGANAAWVQAASDPPVRVYTATPDDTGGGGGVGTATWSITPINDVAHPQTLVSATTSHLSRDHDHICLVTASAWVRQPANQMNTNIVLGLSRGESPVIVEATERPVYLVATDDEDVEFEEVTTTFAFTGVRRDEEFRFSAYYGSGEGELLVGPPTMTVVCLRHPI